MIIDPPETLPDDIFYVTELWNPELPAPDSLNTPADIHQPSCSASIPVVVSTGGPLVDVTNNITPATLAGAAHTATTLATAADLTSNVWKSPSAAAAGGVKGEGREGKKKRGR